MTTLQDTKFKPAECVQRDNGNTLGKVREVRIALPSRPEREIFVLEKGYPSVEANHSDPPQWSDQLDGVFTIKFDDISDSKGEISLLQLGLVIAAGHLSQNKKYIIKAGPIEGAYKMENVMGFRSENAKGDRIDDQQQFLAIKKYEAGEKGEYHLVAVFDQGKELSDLESQASWISRKQ